MLFLSSISYGVGSRWLPLNMGRKTTLLLLLRLADLITCDNGSITACDIAYDALVMKRTHNDCPARIAMVRLVR